jgi:YD repeat-containing protein
MYHTWDDLDRRTERRVSAVGASGSLPIQTTDYVYDDADRIRSIRQNGLTTTYVWDVDNRLTDKTLPNGINMSGNVAGFSLDCSCR